MTPEELRRRLSPFSDPATTMSVDATNPTRIRMTRDGQPLALLFDNHRFEATTGDSCHTFSSLASLLASPLFADTRTLRSTQARVYSSNKDEHVLAPEGTIESRHEHRTIDLNFETFCDLASSRTPEHVSIVLLDGPAGVGKTYLLDRVAHARATAGADLPPLIIVRGNRGRLANLDQALAHATQCLRSSISYDQVPFLAAQGVLQIAIDGFDELVDPEGYQDAWTALGGFLSAARGGYPVILAGRDTFFDQQEFERKLIRRLPEVTVARANLTTPSAHNAKIYLLKNGWSENDVNAAEQADWFEEDSYRLRPFFLSRIAEAGGWDALRGSHGSPQSFIVEQFTRREVALLQSVSDAPAKDLTKALNEFYGLIVEDMAFHQRDIIDEEFLDLACDMAFGTLLSADHLRKIRHRSASFGMLEVGGSKGQRSFPHSEVQDQFLARSLLTGLPDSVTLYTFLRRGIVSASLGQAFGDACLTSQRSSAGVAQTRDVLSAIINDNRTTPSICSNCTALILASTVVDSTDVARASNTTIRELRLHGTLGSAILDSIHFDILDLRGSDCTRWEWTNCSIDHLIVDNATRFGASFPQSVSSVREHRFGRAIATLYDPNECIRLIRRGAGPNSESTIAEPPTAFLEYFDRLCRRFSRQHQIRGSIDDESYSLIADTRWADVLAILGDRIQKNTRNTGGPRDVFFRMIRPQALLSPPADDPESRSIRERIAARGLEIERQ